MICSEIIKIMKLLVIHSVIKGCHIYHLIPHRDILIIPKTEHANSYDENAMIVEIPQTEDLLPISQGD